MVYGVYFVGGLCVSDVRGASAITVNCDRGWWDSSPLAWER
jgi:hypothetical protein